MEHRFQNFDSPEEAGVAGRVADSMTVCLLKSSQHVSTELV